MKTKKIIAWLAAFTMVLTSAPSFGRPFSVSAADNSASSAGEADLSGLEFETFSTFAVLMECAESKYGDVVIPESYEGLPVTEIAPAAFGLCKHITSVKLPDTLVEIGELAFHSCTELKSVEIPDSVEVIGGGAFRDCTMLTDITAPKSLRKLGDRILYGTAWEKEHSSESIMYLGSWFYGCAEGVALSTLSLRNGTVGIADRAMSETGITRAELPEGLKYIGDHAFDDCRSLYIVSLFDGLEEIGSGAFQGCGELEYATVPATVKKVGWGAFKDCKKLKTIEIFNPKCDIFDLDITISNGAVMRQDENGIEYEGGFYDGVIIGLKNSTAEAYAEKYGYKFEAIDIFNYDFMKVKSYDDHIEIVKVLNDLREKLVIPDMIAGLPVTKICDNALERYSALEEIVLPDTLLEIGEEAFNGCTSLRSIDIPDSVEKIGSQAFVNCRALSNVDLPDSLKSLGDYVFGMTALDMKGRNNVVYIDNWVYFFNEPLDEQSRDVEIEDGTVGIADRAFERHTVENVTLPKSLKYIGNNAFESCGRLKTITILAPDCVIPDSRSTISNDITDPDSSPIFTGTIRGYAGSTAEAYALKYGCKFEELEPEEDTLLGDANCDGDVNLADAIYIMQYIANQNKYPLSAQGAVNADVVDNDGVTNKDALEIQRYTLGLISKLG